MHVRASINYTKMINLQKALIFGNKIYILYFLFINFPQKFVISCSKIKMKCKRQHYLKKKNDFGKCP